MQIKSFTDGGVQWIPLYDQNKIVAIKELATGSKSYERLHTFNCSENLWQHYFDDKIETYVLKNNLIVKRDRNFAESSEYFYEDNKLSYVLHTGDHDGDFAKETWTWVNDKPVQIQIYNANNDLIEYRDIKPSSRRNSLLALDPAIKSVLFDSVGYSYFFTSVDYDGFRKSTADGKIFSKYSFKFKFSAAGDLLKMERLGSDGAKLSSNLIFEY